MFYGLLRIDPKVTECVQKLKELAEKDNDFNGAKAKEIENVLSKNMDQKIDYKIELTRNDLNSRIDDLETNVNEVLKDV